MQLQGCGIPSRYSVDLVDLHSLCEANYARLLKLFPDYERCNCRRLLAGTSQVAFEVTERARYTTTVRICHLSQLPVPQSSVQLEIRLYHDAGMAEVVGVPSHRRIDGRYTYPNPQMYHRDEKHQQNRYVAELLSFCLAEGRAPDPVSLPESQ